MVQNLVQNDWRYLLLRGATYYFRFPTPTHVRRLIPSLPREVKRSLKTDSLSQARALVGQKIPLIRLIYSFGLIGLVPLREAVDALYSL